MNLNDAKREDGKEEDWKNESLCDVSRDMAVPAMQAIIRLSKLGLRTIASPRMG